MTDPKVDLDRLVTVVWQRIHNAAVGERHGPYPVKDVASAFRDFAEGLAILSSLSEPPVDASRTQAD